MWAQSVKSRCLPPIAVIVFAFLALAMPDVALAQTSQSPAEFPSKWTDAVEKLAGKIADRAGSTKTISLEVKNISSLSAADADSIRQALEAELARGKFRVLPAASTETHVMVTLSEGVDDYVWVSQVQSGLSEQVEMVSMARAEAPLPKLTGAGLRLEKKLVWTQATKFLGFALFTAPVVPTPTLVIVEENRLAYYRSEDGTQWQFAKAVPIVRSASLHELRDLRGFIDDESGVANLPETICREVGDPDKAHCEPGDSKVNFAGTGVTVPGHERSETESLSGQCGEDSVVLSTGNGDWTQPDQIQGYLYRGGGAAHGAGEPVQVQGPVISLERSAKENAARAIVRNLETGRYEGYIVSANCSD